jgi:hypothetical protein
LDKSTLRQIRETAQSNPNFPRLLNRDLLVVVQNAQIHSSNRQASNMFISRIPHAIDTFQQFVSPVYAAFWRYDSNFPIQPDHCDQRITDIFSHNNILRKYLQESSILLRGLLLRQSAESNQGMNWAISNTDGTFVTIDGIDAVNIPYQSKRTSRHLILYHNWCARQSSGARCVPNGRLR